MKLDFTCQCGLQNKLITFPRFTWIFFLSVCHFLYSLVREISISISQARFALNRSKLKQTEMECEDLKRWFGSLTEQNRRLHKEVEELRAMKVGPPTVLSPHNCEPLPASTLTMCPRCERVTATIAVQQDRAGPTTATATGTTTSANPTLSAKVGFVRPRHPSAAC